MSWATGPPAGDPHYPPQRPSCLGPGETAVCEALFLTLPHPIRTADDLRRGLRGCGYALDLRPLEGDLRATGFAPPAPLDASTFLRLMARLKGRHEAADRHDAPTELLEAFVALGGNADGSGELSPATLRAALRAVDLPLPPLAGREGPPLTLERLRRALLQPTDPRTPSWDGASNPDLGDIPVEPPTPAAPQSRPVTLLPEDPPGAAADLHRRLSIAGAAIALGGPQRFARLSARKLSSSIRRLTGVPLNDGAPPSTRSSPATTLRSPRSPSSHGHLPRAEAAETPPSSARGAPTAAGEGLPTVGEILFDLLAAEAPRRKSPSGSRWPPPPRPHVAPRVRASFHEEGPARSPSPAGLRAVRPRAAPAAPSPGGPLDAPAAPSPRPSEGPTDPSPPASPYLTDGDLRGIWRTVVRFPDHEKAHRGRAALSPSADGTRTPGADGPAVPSPSRGSSNVQRNDVDSMLEDLLQGPPRSSRRDSPAAAAAGASPAAAAVTRTWVRVYVEDAPEPQEHLLCVASLGALRADLDRRLLVRDPHRHVYRGAVPIDRVSVGDPIPGPRGGWRWKPLRHPVAVLRPGRVLHVTLARRPPEPSGPGRGREPSNPGACPSPSRTASPPPGDLPAAGADSPARDL